MAGHDWNPDLGGSGSETTGQRIARARKRRGLTQTGLAAKANISRSLIAQVESGHKPATPSLVAVVARACGVDAAEINGQPYRGSDKRSDAVHAAIPAIRRALAYADVSPELDIPPRSLDELASELVKLQKLKGAAAHVLLGSHLPAAIEELTVHAMESDAPKAWRLLNRAYAIAVSLTRRLGYIDLAQVAIDRTATTALRADDPHLRHLIPLSRALLLLALGSGDIALTMAKQAANNVDRSEPAGLEVYGSLHLRAAISAARIGCESDAWEHHGLAAETAARIAPQDRLDPYGLQMNPVNVAIHGCAVATELGDYDTAIRLDADFKQPTKLTAERRAHHEIDMARAHLWLNNHNKALKRVLNAERIAPQMTRFHPTARETVRQLGTHYRLIPEELHGLESRMAF
ncbi:helix-turn-helix domain-containing protein [Streptosporangium sp. NPDC000396]|uniref:helix-turn-helix domain-containing protein n=1 Tax=Streptosporangium sp. NPDC000396 TaxID=3366185 RepID=UPI0036A13091